MMPRGIMVYGLLLAFHLGSTGVAALSLGHDVAYCRQQSPRALDFDFEPGMPGKYKVSYRLGHANGMGYQGRWIQGGTLILNRDHTARIVVGKRVDPYLWTFTGVTLHLYGNQDMPGDPRFELKIGVPTSLVGEWQGFTFQFQKLP